MSDCSTQAMAPKILGIDLGDDMDMSVLSECVHIPGECPHEGSVLDDGKHSFCEKWNRWTNCRQVEHCVMEGASEKANADELEDAEAE